MAVVILKNSFFFFFNKVKGISHTNTAKNELEKTDTVFGIGGF